MWDLPGPGLTQTRVPCIGRRILNHCANREAPMPVLSPSAKLQPTYFIWFPHPENIYIISIKCFLCEREVKSDGRHLTNAGFLSLSPHPHWYRPYYLWNWALSQLSLHLQKGQRVTHPPNTKYERTGRMFNLLRKMSHFQIVELLFTTERYLTKLC